MAGAKCKYRDHFPDVIRAKRRDGFSLQQIAAELRVGKSTLLGWANNPKSPLTAEQQAELSLALEESKLQFLSKVKLSLGRRALGFRYTETKTVGTREKDKKGQEQVVVQRFEKTEKEVIPDVNACMQILTNQAGWKFKQAHEVSGPDGEPLPEGTSMPKVVIYIPDNGRGDNHNDPAVTLSQDDIIPSAAEEGDE